MQQIMYWLKYEKGTYATKKKENAQIKCANALPNWLKYWVVVLVAADVSYKNPQQIVPEITWDQMAKTLLKG